MSAVVSAGVSSCGLVCFSADVCESVGVRFDPEASFSDAAELSFLSSDLPKLLLAAFQYLFSSKQASNVQV